MKTNTLSAILNPWTPYAFSVLLIVVGFLFLPHGMQKLFAYPAPPPGGKPPFVSLYGIAGLLEFVGSILIMLGLFTRVAAFILSGEMAVAYFTVHAPQGFWPSRNEGESAALFCFIFLSGIYRWWTCQC